MQGAGDREPQRRCRGWLSPSPGAARAARATSPHEPYGAPPAAASPPRLRAMLPSMMVALALLALIPCEYTTKSTGHVRQSTGFPFVYSE